MIEEESINMINLYDLDVDAFLFDLDGVLLDTEGKYQEFWEGIAEEYGLDPKVFPISIKGQTTDTIVDDNFIAEVRESIKERYHQYQQNMSYEFFNGAQDILKACKAKGIKTAIVTSSDKAKMHAVHQQHPYLSDMVDVVLTAEDFNNPKPSPQCWLIAAKCLDVGIAKCVIFEDSINGLKSAKASGGYVVGLTTTHTEELVNPFCYKVISDISQFYKL